MAAATRHLGFGVTVNLTYEAPYLLARRFSTLDHLTQGRVGWNIVTGYLERGARHGAVRADRARRALRPRRRIPGRGLSAVGRQLGRGRGQGRQARAGLCRSRRRAPGGPCRQILSCSRLSPGRAFAAAHAGAVPGGLVGPGLAFAARHAECVFVSSQTKEGLRKLVSELREAVAREGRDPRDIKFFMGITAVVGRTERKPGTSTPSTCATPVPRLAWRTTPAPPASIFPPTRRTSRSAT